MFFLCWSPYVYTTCPLVTVCILVSLHTLFSSFEMKKADVCRALTRSQALCLVFTWLPLIFPIVLQNRHCHSHLTDRKQIQRDSRTLLKRGKSEQPWDSFSPPFLWLSKEPNEQDWVLSTEQVTTHPIPGSPFSLFLVTPKGTYCHGDMYELLSSFW